MKLKNTIIIKYYILIVFTLLSFITIGIGAYQYLIKNIFPESADTPPIFIAKTIDLLDRKDKLVAMKKFDKLKSGLLAPDMDLLDENDTILFSDHQPSEKETLTDLHQLVKPYDYLQLGKTINNKYDYFSRHLFKFRPRRPVYLVRLNGEPARYVKITPPEYLKEKHKSIIFFIFSIITLLISLFVGVALAIFFIFISITKHNKIVNYVISELQKGNLKVRFPIQRMDEFGRAMLKFNHMVDELEQLILSSRHAERVRINLLQELTHDLKTPISSLKMLLETLETNEQSLDSFLKNELLALSRKEVEYFARLVDDLLLIAQMTEPKYHIRQEVIDLPQLLIENINDTTYKEVHKNDKKIIKKFSDESKFVRGDNHLLMRAFRNTLENAVYHAREVVSIDIKIIDTHRLKVVIEDDGKGFSNEILKCFGERSSTRKVSDKADNRMSIGLGSVIIKTICELHSAKLNIKNNMNDANQVIGASLEIELAYF